MARTSVESVKAGFTTSASDEDIQAAIDEITVSVTLLLSDKGYTDERLELIERYLVRDRLTHRSGTLQAVRRGDISETYVQGGAGRYWLEQAIALDPSGTLADEMVEDRPRFSFRVGAGYDSDLDLPAAG